MKKQTSPGLHLIKHGNQHGTRYFWRLIGLNGRQLDRSSETYTTKEKAIKGMLATQKGYASTNSFTDWTKNEPVTRPIVFP